jgi:uncharacterized membrane protein YeiH
MDWPSGPAAERRWHTGPVDDERPPRRSRREGTSRLTVTGVVRQVDLAATGTFAVEGAIAGVKDHLDIFGVIVIACVTAFGGGMVRDVLIGDTPPAALRDRLYIPLALTAGFVVFLLYKPVEDIPLWLFNGLDAVGLSLFAVAGSQKSLDFGLNDVSSAFLGVLTAVGGGTLAAVLLGKVPAVLRVDIYAVAALLGGAVVVVGSRLGWRRGPTMLAGALCCFALRVLSLWQHWNLPHH